MKEFNVNININWGGTISLGLGLLTFGYLSVYYCENGYLPFWKNGEFGFTSNKVKQVETN